MPAGDTLTIQAGPAANWVGTHLWQLVRAQRHQQSGVPNEYASEPRGNVVDGYKGLFHESENEQRPRLVIVDHAESYREYAVPPERPGLIQRQDVQGEPSLLWEASRVKTYNRPAIRASTVQDGVWSAAVPGNAMWHPRSVVSIDSGHVDRDSFCAFSQGLEWFGGIGEMCGGEQMMDDSVRFFAEACDHLSDVVILADTRTAYAGIASSLLSEFVDDYGSRMGITVFGFDLGVDASASTAVHPRSAAKFAHQANQAHLMAAANEHNAHFFPVAGCTSALASLGIENLFAAALVELRTPLSHYLGSLRANPCWRVSALSMTYPFDHWTSSADEREESRRRRAQLMGTLSLSPDLNGALSRLSPEVMSGTKRLKVALAGGPHAELVVLRGACFQSSRRDHAWYDPESLDEALTELHPHARYQGLVSCDSLGALFMPRHIFSQALNATALSSELQAALDSEPDSEVLTRTSSVARAYTDVHLASLLSRQLASVTKQALRVDPVAYPDHVCLEVAEALECLADSLEDSV
ncbi:Protein dml1 [Porphyridium purpureum]|uniref:Protein dml1 n=1 Tax=Porphyridium purpureum TaxID=35688 RepID=A0A5J4Z6R5_PORPP|nr:Protein dml1 [Porphyridium purpureum]|eukprot:POR9449..scf295_1